MGLMSEEVRKKLTKIEEEVTKKIFCASCQTFRVPDPNGVRRKIAGRSRYTCGICLARVKTRQHKD